MDASKLGAIRISAGTAAAVVISAVALVAVWASPAAALTCPTPGHSDINGDGHADAVGASPDETTSPAEFMCSMGRPED
jgi:hypothetical protein